MSKVDVFFDIYDEDSDGPTGQTINFIGDDDLDCTYIGWVRVVPRDGYIDVPAKYVHEFESE